jgi:transcriptional regulator with XRE-family HTH domain
MATDSSSIGYRVGYRMRAQRQKRDMTQEEVAFRVGITASYLGQLERGGRGLTVEKLVKIAKVLKVDPAELLKGI